MNELVFYATYASRKSIDTIHHKCLTNIKNVQFAVDNHNSSINEIYKDLFGGSSSDNIKLKTLKIIGSNTFKISEIHSIKDLFKFWEIDEIKLQYFLISTPQDFEILLKGIH